MLGKESFIMKFEHAPLKKSFWRFILPSVVAQWIFALYTMVDGMFVARGVGETALSAVNIAMPFINTLFSISILFAVGTSTVVAIYLGQGEKKQANSIYTQNMIVLLVLSALVTALIYLKIDDFALFLGATPATLPYVKEYILSILPFGWCFILSYSFETLIKTDGFPRYALAAVTGGALINCVLDYLFVFVFGWGIGGAGVATGISQMIVIVFYLAHFLSGRSTLRFIKTRLEPKKLLRVFRLGLSSGLTEISAGVIVFLFNQVILRYIGEEGIVSYTIIAYVNTIVTMSMVGVAQGVQPLISFFYGKEEYSSCRKLMRYSLTLTLAASAAFFAVVWLGADVIVSWFVGSDLPELAAFSAGAMRIFSISFLVVGINVLAGGMFTAVEKPAASLFLSVLRGLVCLVGALWVCTALWGGSGIWWAAAASETLCLVFTCVMTARYRKNAPLFTKK